MMRYKYFVKKYAACFVWLFGLSFGVFTAYISNNMLDSSFCNNFFSLDCSFLSVFVSSFIPAIAAFFFLLLKKRNLLLILLFLKAFTYGFGMMLISFLQCGNGLFLLGSQMLSGSCSAMCIIYFALPNITDHKKGFSLFFVILFALFLICVLDFWLSYILYHF